MSRAVDTLTLGEGLSLQGNIHRLVEIQTRLARDILAREVTVNGKRVDGNRGPRTNAQGCPRLGCRVAGEPGQCRVTGPRSHRAQEGGDHIRLTRSSETSRSMRTEKRPWGSVIPGSRVSLHCAFADSTPLSSSAPHCHHPQAQPGPWKVRRLMKPLVNSFLGAP